MLCSNRYIESSLSSAFIFSKFTGSACAQTTHHAIHLLFFNLISSSKEDVPSALCFFAAKNLFSFTSNCAIDWITDKSAKSSTEVVLYAGLSWAVSIFSAKFFINALQGTPFHHSISPYYIAYSELAKKLF